MEASSNPKCLISTHEDSFSAHHLKLFHLWGQGNFGRAGTEELSAHVVK